LGSFCENYRSSNNDWATFFNSKSYVLIITKKWIRTHFGRFLGGFGQFWAIFSQTHLVTLLSANLGKTIIFPLHT
jgi:hypothetical protein